MSSRVRGLLAAATGLGVTALLPLPGALPASAAGIPVFRPHHVLYDVSVHSRVTPAQADRAALASSTFTQFTATINVGTTSYTYVMAGKNSGVRQSHPAATIKAELVPLIIKFANGDTWNPAKTDSCDHGASALTRVQNSPLVKNWSWTWGDTAIGSGQATDAYQRADFWKYARPGGSTRPMPST